MLQESSISINVTWKHLSLSLRAWSTPCLSSSTSPFSAGFLQAQSEITLVTSLWHHLLYLSQSFCLCHRAHYKTKAENISLCSLRLKSDWLYAHGIKSCTTVCVQQLFSCVPLKADLSLSYYHMCKTFLSLVMCFNRTAVTLYLILCDINRTQPLLRISYISSYAPSYKCADTACVTCHLPPLQNLFFFF